MKYAIDLQEIADYLDFDLEDVEMLIEVFLEGAYKNMQELKIAINMNNLQDIHKAAHAIKGSAANLTFANIADIAKEIEENAKKSNTVDYDKKYEELKVAIDDISA